MSRMFLRAALVSLALALPPSLQLALASLAQGRPGAETISALLDIAPDRAIDTLSSWLDSLREVSTLVGLAVADGSRRTRASPMKLW